MGGGGASLFPMKRSHLLLLLILALGACGGQAAYRDVEGLDFHRVESIDGRDYEVKRLRDGANLFQVGSRDGKSALREDMLRALRLVSRCESHKVLEEPEGGASLTVQGMFCLTATREY